MSVTPIVADISTPEGQAAVLAACPNPDILINNNRGLPFRDFRELDRAAMLDGVTLDMVTPIELIQKVINHMTAQRFGRIVNITSMSVKMAVPGLDLSSGARAGLTAFFGGCGTHRGGAQRHHQQYPARLLRYRPAARRCGSLGEERRCAAGASGSAACCGSTR